MSLQEFLNKWSDGTRKLENMILVAFNRDPRTIRLWKRETPEYMKVAFKVIDRLWTIEGKPNYGIFFE